MTRSVRSRPAWWYRSRLRCSTPSAASSSSRTRSSSPKRASTSMAKAAAAGIGEAPRSPRGREASTRACINSQPPAPGSGPLAALSRCRLKGWHSAPAVCQGTAFFGSAAGPNHPYARLERAGWVSQVLNPIPRALSKSRIRASRSALSGTAFYANRGLAVPAVRQGAVEHLDSVDGAFPASQIEGTRALATLEDVADLDVVGGPVGIDHLEVQHLDVAAARKQTDGREAAFPPSNTHDVTVAPETDPLAPQLDPVAIAAATTIVVSPLGDRIGRKRARQHQRTRQCRRHVSQLHCHLPDCDLPNNARVFLTASRRENGRHLSVLLRPGRTAGRACSQCNAATL